MDTLKSLIKNNIRQYGMIIALISIMLFFQILTNGILLKPLNITNLVLQNSYILVMAVGMLMVIITGNIDLSVGSVAAFIGALSAMLMVNMKVPFVTAVVVSILVGAAVGAWHGFWIAYVKIPGFIVTLAGMLIFRGLTLAVLGGQSIGPFPVAFKSISSGFIPDAFGGNGLHILTIVIGAAFSLFYVFNEFKDRKEKLKYNFDVIPIGFLIAKIVAIVAVMNIFTYILATYKGIPNIFILLFAIIALYSFITDKTVVGRHIYAVGGNEKAARLSGIKTKRVLFLVYMNMGIMAAISGLVFASRLNSATPQAGINFELDAIAACYIGGASASGGVGTVVGAIIGGLVMGIMNNGMSILGVQTQYQMVIKGLILLFAVCFDIYTKSKSA